ncbi:hypothetical protein CRI94_16590 [Longibacter salinarum]|uniref:PDZ domain-containing protein n=1 Tax=Longibacter salinarum TaxID=1850348 RepID=A0A2A8CTZ9_9BACT|nr:hypothetical protein [Longibacter salinarum]PEN11204.1 hypothetical protein CRI94_16590 [Longibacter salinarum]
MYTFISYLLSLLAIVFGTIVSEVAPVATLAVTTASSAIHAIADPMPPEPPQPEALEDIAAGESMPGLSFGIVDEAEASRLVYVEGDVGVAIRGRTVSLHVDGRPVDGSHVVRKGGGWQIFNNGTLRAEVAVRETVDELTVDWIWAPAPYYAVTFPSIGLRVAGADLNGIGSATTTVPHLQIASVVSGSSADAAGLKAGMYVAAVGDVRRASPLDLRAALRETPSGGAIDLHVQTHLDGPERTISLAPKSGGSA